VWFDSGVTSVNYATEGGNDTVFVTPGTTTTFNVLKSGATPGTVTLATYGTAATESVTLTPAPTSSLGYVSIGGGYRPVSFNSGVDNVNYATEGGGDTVFVGVSTTNTFTVLKTGATGGYVTVATYGTAGNDVATLTAAPSGGLGSLALNGYRAVYFDANVDQVNFDGSDGDDTLYVNNVGSPRRFAYLGGSGTDTLYYKPGWLASIVRIGVEIESPY
jgi:hypothetical protein